MEFQTVQLERDGRFAVIWLDRPDHRNAINSTMLDELHEVVQETKDDDDIRCLILAGKDSNFCSGADLEEMKGWDDDEATRRSEQAAELIETLESSDLTTVAAIHGYCLGGGHELALACDFRTATGSSVFGQPETRVGLVPGFGGTARLVRMLGLARAKSLILSGRKVPFSEAESIGLVDRQVPDNRVVGATKEWVGEILDTTSPLAYARAKELLYGVMDKRYDEAVEDERDVFAEMFDTRDMQEGIDAFLDRREPDFGGE